MPNSTYKIVELVGSSEESWEQAVRNAVDTAARSLKDLRVAEITKLDLRIEDNKIVAYRARLNLSFKYLPEEHAKEQPPQPKAARPRRRR